MQAAVFFDRDGTLIKECEYLSHPGGVELLPGAVEGVKGAQALGFLCFIVTNQAGIGRGYYTEADFRAVEKRTVQLFAESGVFFDGIYHCPHHPDEACGCRKPATGMIDQACQDLSVNLPYSLVVGDKPCDILLAKAAGCASVLVTTGYGADYNHSQEDVPDREIASLAGLPGILIPLLGGQLARKRQEVEWTPLAREMYTSSRALPVREVRPGVGVFIRDCGGRILLERRSDNGLWSPLGGRVEAGESAVAAAVREVREESGLEVVIDRLIGCYSEPLERTIVYPGDDTSVQFFDLMLEGHVTGGQLAPSPESLEVKFFLPAALPFAGIVPPARQPLEDLLFGRFGCLR